MLQAKWIDNFGVPWIEVKITGYGFMDNKKIKQEDQFEEIRFFETEKQLNRFVKMHNLKIEWT